VQYKRQNALNGGHAGMRANLRKIGHNKSFSRNDKVLWIKHRRTRTINWDAIGAIGEIVGVLGQMDWNAIGAVGEIVGALAVIGP